MSAIPGTRQDRIVVVDDDARIRDLLRRYLSQEGFDVLLAEDGKALNRLLTRENARPDRARPDAAGRGRPGDLPPPARRQRPHARSSCSPPRATTSTASSAWRWAPTTTCPSRSTRASCWRASTRCCAAARRRRRPGAPAKDAQVVQLRRLRVRPRHAPPDEGRQADRADHRRILDAEGAGAAPAPAAVARQADGARARPRIRAVRPQPRRADLAPAQDRRGRPVATRATSRPCGASATCSCPAKRPDWRHARGDPSRTPC